MVILDYSYTVLHTVCVYLYSKIIFVQVLILNKMLLMELFLIEIPVDGIK